MTGEPTAPMRVIDLERQVEVVNRGRRANNFWTRLRGLLATAPMHAGEGLLLEPCNSIHMFFMGYAIDALYLDSDNRVIKIAANLEPWRIGPGMRQARRVLELPAGQAARCGVSLNDRLFITG